MKLNKLTDVSQSDIQLAASLSAAAYEDSIPGAFKYVSKIGACAYLQKRNDTQFVIWRGTNSGIDWLANIACIPWRVKGKWVHGGFALQQASVWKPIRKQLNPSVKTYVVGHSLGGACATITAAKLVGQNFKDVRLITMGRPNTWFRSKTPLGATCNISVVAGSDIVCTVPRTYGSAADQHIIFMANDGKDYLDPDKEFRDADRRSHLKESISDHMMNTSYIPRIKSLKLEKLCTDTPS